MASRPFLQRCLFPMAVCIFFVASTPCRVFGNLFDHRSAQSPYQNVVVERVLSADTLVLKGGEKIRMIGLKAPEPPRRQKIERDKQGVIVERDTPETTIEEKAFAFAQSLLEGQAVRLEFDEQKKDEDFITLAYVFLVENDVFVNAEILRQGFADLQLRAPNLKYSDILRRAYREAREQLRGLRGE